MKSEHSYRRDVDCRGVAVTVALACATLLAPVQLALGAGKPGNFRLAPTSPLTYPGSGQYDYYSSPRTGKLDDEPGIDLVTGNGPAAKINVWSGAGDGDFAPIRQESIPGHVVEITAAELDGENGADLAVATPDDVAVLLNDGTGDFAAPGTSPEASAGGGITSTDLDDDEDIDLVVGSGFESAEDASVLLNDGSGDFTAGDSFEAPESMVLANADLDDDGDPDVVGLSGFSDQALVSFNDGDGNLTDGAAITGGSGEGDATGLAVSRINKDRSPDVAVAKSTGIDVFLNDGDGNFSASPHAPIGSGRNFTDVRLDDVDGDGRRDVIGAEILGPGSQAAAIFRGKANGGFAEPATSPEEATHGSGPVWLAAGKFDDRGGKDLALTTNLGIGVLLNRSPAN